MNQVYEPGPTFSTYMCSAALNTHGFLFVLLIPFILCAVHRHPRQASAQEGDYQQKWYIHHHRKGACQGPYNAQLEGFFGQAQQKGRVQGCQQRALERDADWVARRPDFPHLGSMAREHEKQRGFHKMPIFVVEFRAVERAAIATRKNSGRVRYRSCGRRSRLPAWRQKSPRRLQRRRSVSRSASAPGYRSRTRAQKDKL